MHVAYIFRQWCQDVARSQFESLVPVVDTLRYRPT